MEKNIFEAMSKKPQKDGDGKSRGPGPVPLPRPAETDLERDSMLKRMNEMKAELQQQLDQVYSKGKEANLPLSALVKEVSELAPADQEELRRREKELKDKLNAVLPGTVPTGKGGTGGADAGNAKRGKMRSARNKWIPVK